MELWQLIARESIRDAIARYNANGDAGRIDAVVNLFTPDAVVEILGKTYRGHDGIRNFFAAATASISSQGKAVKYVRHSTTTLQIDLISPTAAKSRCYFSVVDDKGMHTWGRYIDEYSSADGSWHFAKRQILFDQGGPSL
jgi:uncharacterized protein (TIGR02246 family)